ncbi:MAG TPA: ClC family H(+)/Cl(-) exchange transporter [Candidatus Acidoferrales bacterium]|nr:ClC family H(+)/Cl(-) exchange transporter [Candidatus Acidoferrales bacterium]
MNEIRKALDYSTLVLALLSIAVGGFAGLAGASFLLLLRGADACRLYLVARAHSLGWLGLVLVVCSIGFVAALAAWLVFRFAPQSVGSGIPQIERELRVGSSGNPLSTVIVKFIGGILSIGGGLALGREGPTVQMGGCIGDLIGRAFQRNAKECRVLLAAGAGAGLAAAFNAPIAGAVFILEELVGSFEIPVIITSLGASAAAILVSGVFLGQSPDFHVPAIGFLNFWVLPVSLLLGVVIGLLGVAYNHSIVATLNLSRRFSKFHGTLRAASIGAVVGLLGWFAPALIGGGDSLTQRTLDGNLLLTTLAPALVLRFLLGPASYAARTPGGLFAPMLTVGAQAGLLFFMFWSRLVPSTGALSQEFTILGMAAFFSSVVRAPITGIILIVELTGSFTLFLPMLGATFAAVTTASLLRSTPIYDSLRDVH